MYQFLADSEKFSRGAPQTTANSRPPTSKKNPLEAPPATEDFAYMTGFSRPPMTQPGAAPCLFWRYPWMACVDEQFSLFIYIRFVTRPASSGKIKNPNLNIGGKWPVFFFIFQNLNLLNYFPFLA